MPVLSKCYVSLQKCYVSLQILWDSFTKSAREWLHEPLKTWHLIVALLCLFWYTDFKLAMIYRRINEVATSVDVESASQTQMLVDALKRLGVPILEQIKDND